MQRISYWFYNCIHYHSFVRLQIIQLKSKGKRLGQQGKISMPKPQELKPKRSTVTFTVHVVVERHADPFLFCFQKMYHLGFFTFNVVVVEDDDNFMMKVTFDSVTFPLCVCVSLLPQKLFVGFVIRFGSESGF